MIASPTARLVAVRPGPGARARLRYAFARLRRAVRDPRAGRPDGGRHGAATARTDEDVRRHAGRRLPPTPGRRPRRPPRSGWTGCRASTRPAPASRTCSARSSSGWPRRTRLACTQLDDVGPGAAGAHAGRHARARPPGAVGQPVAGPVARRGPQRRCPGCRPTRRRRSGPGTRFVASHDLDHLSPTPAAQRRAGAQERGHRGGCGAGTRAPACRSSGRPRGGWPGAARPWSASTTCWPARPTAGCAPPTPWSPSRPTAATRATGSTTTCGDTLARIAEQGHELAVHGSYHSLVEPGQLAREYRLLRRGRIPGRPAGASTGCGTAAASCSTRWSAAGAGWDSTLRPPRRRRLPARRGVPVPALRPRPRAAALRSWRSRWWSWSGRCARLSADPAAWPGIATDVLGAAGTDGWGGTAVLWHDYAFTGHRASPAARRHLLGGARRR